MPCKLGPVLGVKLLFAMGKLALITLCAAIVYVRSKRPTASSPPR